MDETWSSKPETVFPIMDLILLFCSWVYGEMGLDKLSTEGFEAPATDDEFLINCPLGVPQEAFQTP